MKTDLWNSLLDAELNEKYWSHLSRRYYNRDKFVKIFLAVMASGTVASWGIWQKFEIIWKTLSGLSALVAIALPILNLSKKINDLSQLSQKWTEIRSDYELLWLDFNKTHKNEEQIMREYKIIKAKENKTSELESNLPNDKKLIEKCYDEVLISRGL
jgi:hypothetical protein